MLHSVEVDLGGGRTITLETGKMAKQANGSVIVRSGESVVLLQRGHYGWALAHTAVHLLGSVACCIAGFATWRAIA